MHIHFIGIGGIGVSALAQYYLAKGFEVSGSDLSKNETIDFLRKKGAKISVGSQRKENLHKDADLVIYSPAVERDNPEMREAERKGIECKSYPEALGDLTRKYFTIAVSGTHGKSTTTAMAALVLVCAKLDPVVIVGTKLKEFKGSNFRMGKKILLIEADEHFASFLNYRPKTIVLTNIEKDHLDYYKNLGNLLKSFKKYVKLLPEDGTLIANRDDRNVRNIDFENTCWYSLKSNGKDARLLKKILKVPGSHNVSNALAVLALARRMGIKDKISFSALGKFNGTWRRFETREANLKGKRKVIVVSDYGHHPTEVLATVRAAREKWPEKKIWLVFQPHQLQRTFYLFNDFVSALRSVPADRIYVTDIFFVAGREEKGMEAKVSSKKLVDKVGKKSVEYVPKAQILGFLENNLRSGEVAIIMGAGDIYKTALELGKE